MSEATSAPAGRKPSRKIGIYAGLWVFAASLGMDILGTVLLQAIFASLTLGAVGRALVSETKTLRPSGMTLSAALYLVCWLFCMLVWGLSPLWMNIVAMIFSSQAGAE